MSEEKKKLNYRFITGPDDNSFCQRISDALDNGYVLYGEPKLIFNGKTNICGQAVVLKDKL